MGAALFAALAAVTLAARSKKPDLATEAAGKLLLRAAEQTQLLAPGGLPFHLKAHALSYDTHGRPTPATIRIWWANPGTWREEVQTPDGTGAIVQSGEHRYSLESDAQKLVSLRLNLAMNPGAGLPLFPREAVKKAKARQILGEQATCYETVIEAPVVWWWGQLQPLRSYNRELCLDAAGLPLEKKDDLSGREFDYADYTPLGMRRFSRRLVYKHDGKTLLDVTVDTFGMMSRVAANWLAPPPHARDLDLCPGMTMPRPVHAAIMAARPPGSVMAWIAMPGQSAMVTISFLIDTKGQVRNFKILDREGYSPFIQTRLDELRATTFYPAACGNQPFAFPVVTEFGVSTTPEIFSYVRGG